MEGNQGTGFLKPCGKPYYICSSEVALDGALLPRGEVLELLEGPERSTSQRLRGVGRALKDQVSGWFDISDASGSYVEELTNLSPRR